MLCGALRARRLLVPLVLFCLFGGVAHAQRDPALERARIQLESGKVYFERGDYRRAIEQFQSADELKPAAAISFNIAQAYERWAEQVSDPVEKAAKLKAAAQNLRTYLQRDPTSSDRADVEKKAARLEGQLAEVDVQTTPPGAQVRVGDASSAVVARTPARLLLPRGSYQLHLSLPAYRAQTKPIDLTGAAGAQPLRVEVTLAATGGTVIVSGLPDGTALTVDGRSAGTTPLAQPLVLEAGRHEVRASRPGAGTATRVVQVSAGDQLTVSMSLRRKVGTLGILGWTVGGVGVALTAVGIGFGVKALRTKSDFDTCQRNLGSGGETVAACTSLQSDGRNAQHIADGTLWPGLALAATGAVLVILDARRGSAAERQAEAPSAPSPSSLRQALRPRIAPVLGAGHYGLAADLRW
jgi:hypothetical protein